MRGSTTIRPASDVAIYWETYGVAPGDTVQMEVRVQARPAPANLVRRIAMQLGLAHSTPNIISVGWSEVASGLLAPGTDASHPIQGHATRLDFSRTAPGAYDIVVSVARSDTVRARAVRGITIQ